jgi:hypothetical protein
VEFLACHSNLKIFVRNFYFHQPTIHHLLLVYADDVNLLDDDIYTIKKNTQTLIDAGKEVDLEANTGKTKYMLLSRHQNAG